MSAILYSYESWLNADLKPVIKLYNWGLKQLLGVRKTTCNDMCYIEAEYPPLQDLVRSRQRKFSKIRREWSLMNDDSLMFTVCMVLSTRYNTQTYIRQLFDEPVNDVALAMEKLKNNILASNSSRRLKPTRKSTPIFLYTNFMLIRI